MVRYIFSILRDYLQQLMTIMMVTTAMVAVIMGCLDGGKDDR